MASEEQKNDESEKGFSGLSSILSDVGDAVSNLESKKPEPLIEVVTIESNMPKPQPVRQAKVWW